MLTMFTGDVGYGGSHGNGQIIDSDNNGDYR